MKQNDSTVPMIAAAVFAVLFFVGMGLEDNTYNAALGNFATYGKWVALALCFVFGYVAFNRHDHSRD